MQVTPKHLPSSIGKYLHCFSNVRGVVEYRLPRLANDPPAKILPKFPMTSDYWQSGSKVKKINQITTASPLAGSRKSRNTETLLDVGRYPTWVHSPCSQLNR